MKGCFPLHKYNGTLDLFQQTSILLTVTEV